MRAKADNRIRKSTKYIYITLAIALIAVSLFDFIGKSSENQNIGNKTQQIYFYKNAFSYNYNVNLIENEYTNGMDLSNKSLAYITELIDNIDLDLNYKYKGDKVEDLDYSYEVIGRTQAVYTKDGEEQKILEKDDILLEKITKTESTDKIEINENIKLNLKQKNASLNSLKQRAGINFVATYSIILNVNVKTEVEGKKIDSIYSPIITIDLAEKTTKIKGDNNKENTEYIAKEMPETGYNHTIIFDIIAFAVAIYLLRYVSKAKVANRIRNEYKHELNRLLKLCQDKIVRIKTKPENNDNVVLVKDFGEIVKLSEELFKPILCWTDDSNDEAWFSVISNNTDYRYILKK